MILIMKEAMPVCEQGIHRISSSLGWTAGEQPWAGNDLTPRVGLGL